MLGVGAQPTADGDRSSAQAVRPMRTGSTLPAVRAVRSGSTGMVPRPAGAGCVQLLEPAGGVARGERPRVEPPLLGLPVDHRTSQ